MIIAFYLVIVYFENSVHLYKLNNIFLINFTGTLGDEITNFGGQSITNKNKKRKLTPKKKGGGKKRKYV